MFDLRSQPSVAVSASAPSAKTAKTAKVAKAGEDAGRSRSGSRKKLAGELARVDATLARLRERVADLYALQRDQEESSSALANRVGALEGAGPASPIPDLALAARIDAMAVQFDAVRAETAFLSDGLAELDLRVCAADSDEPALDTEVRRLEIDALFARMQGAEGALAAAQAELTRLDQRLGAPADQVRPETVALLEQRVGSALDDLQVQQRRIEALDRRDRDAADRGEVERRIGDLRDAFGARLGALEQGLERGLELELDRAQLQVRSHLDQRLGRMGTALGLFGIGLSILFFAAWWQATHRADSTDLRVETLGTRIDQALRSVVADESLETRIDQALDRSVAGVSTRVATLSDGLTRLEQRVAQLGEVSSVGANASPTIGSDADPILGAAPEETSGPVDEAPALVSDAQKRMAVSPVPRGPLVLDAPRWMVQLIGFHGQDSVREFVAARGIAGEAWTVQGSYRGRPWYRVLVGDYADRAAAAAAIDALPPKMRALEPIVRLLEPGTQLEPTDRD